MGLVGGQGRKRVGEELPVMAQVRSLASLSGLRSQRGGELSGVGRRHGSDPLLLLAVGVQAGSCSSD